MVGLEVWNSAGQKTLDTNDRLMRILGNVSSTGSGSLNHAGLQTGTPFYFLLIDESNAFAFKGSDDVSFSGSTMSWTFDADVSVTIIYGVY